MQQVGVLRVFAVCDGQSRTRVESLQSHDAHQTRHPFAVDQIPLAVQVGRHFPVAIEWCSGVRLVKQAHQTQIQGRFTAGLAVERRPVQTH